MATEIPDNILSRMKALEAMAERGTTHEAATAAAMLSDLLARFNMDKVPSERDEPYGRVDMPIEESQWRWVVLNAATQAVGCYGVRLSHGNTVAIIGQKSNIDIAKYTYEVICRAINSLAKNCGNSNRSYRNQFRLGAAVEVQVRMREAREAARTEASKDERGLIVVDDAALMAAVDRVFPRRRSNNITAGGYGYSDGRAAGAGITVNPGVMAGKSAPVAALGRGR